MLPIAAEMAALVALVGIASVPILLIVVGVANCVVVQFWNDVVTLSERARCSQNRAGKTGQSETSPRGALT